MRVLVPQVPEIVRLNIKALHDVLTAHGEALKSIEKAVANKIGRPEHTASMQEKVSVTELTTTFEDLSRVIDNKADARDTSAIVERMTSRAELQAALAEKADVSEVQRCLDAKAGASETQQLIAALESRVAEMTGSVREELAGKAGSSALEAEIGTRCTHAEVRAIVGEAIETMKAELRADIEAAVWIERLKQHRRPPPSGPHTRGLSKPAADVLVLIACVVTTGREQGLQELCRHRPQD